ncbi:MAG: hypothetical protein L6R38_007917 [Xanthoria sp. 2 TBL-2021]|nr:MAG: hypothetical protein L6R38_007917 [Xanthoria sp. 2 TBL-2021]
MPMYNVRPPSSTPAQRAGRRLTNIPDHPEGRRICRPALKDDAKNQGGEVKHEFTLIKGFTVEFPADRATTLETNEHIHVEQDGAVKTQ